LHANAGAVTLGFDDAGERAMTWGLAVQLLLFEPLNVFVEAASGRPETSEWDGVVHGGLKCELSDSFHLDATFGAGAWGDDPVDRFATVGFRWATEL
jgi:hypothetical protein